MRSETRPTLNWVAEESSNHRSRTCVGLGGDSVKRIQSQREREFDRAGMQESASARHSSPQPSLAQGRRVDEGRRYRLSWRRGPRPAQHDQTWGHLSRAGSVVREAATRNAGVTTDACGVATLVVESGGERTHLWRNWQACHYPFVCALLDELGKPNPFRSAAPPARASSADGSRPAQRAARRDRSIRS